MRRFALTIVAGIVTFVCGTVGIICFASLTAKSPREFTGPGEYRFRADRPGEYTLYSAVSGTKDNEYFTVDPTIPTGIKISVTRDGQRMPLKTYGGETTSRMGDVQKSVLRFTVPEAGEYVVSVTGIEEQRVFQIREHSRVKVFIGLVGLFAMAPFGFLVTILFLILALTGAYPKAKPPSAAPVA